MHEVATSTTSTAFFYILNVPHCSLPWASGLMSIWTPRCATVYHVGESHLNATKLHKGSTTNKPLVTLSITHNHYVTLSHLRSKGVSVV